MGEKPAPDAAGTPSGTGAIFSLQYQLVSFPTIKPAPDGRFGFLRPPIHIHATDELPYWLLEGAQP
jgi:hypothetical protein